MRHHDGREVGGADPEPGQGVTYHRRGRGGPGFHQAWPLAPDQVAGRDPVIPGHPGIDLEHLVSQRGDVRCLRVRDAFVHPSIVPDRANPSSDRPHIGRDFSSVRPQSDGPNVRSTSPVRGLGPNDVDLRGTRSPCAAIWMTASKESGLEMTAVAPVPDVAYTA